MKRLSDNAIEIVNELHTERLAYESEYIPLIDALNRLAEYEDMEEQGLLVRLPCKVGDRVYFLDTCHTAEDFGKKFVSWGKVTKVSIAGMYVCLKIPTGLPHALSWESIFTTREAAEKALEEV